MKKYYLLPLLIAICSCIHAQEEDEVCLDPSKKVMKLINAGTDAKDAQTAVTNFKAAIEMDESNATAYYAYAMYAYQTGMDYYKTYPNPTMGDKSLEKAEEMFRETIERCSDYHANCTYYLGVINYRQQDMAEALKWFKQFKAYKHSDTKRYPNDFTDKIATVDKVIGDLEQDQKIKSEKVPFEPQIVRYVSTGNEEYFPMISPDNELMFYTRKLDKRNRGDLISNVVEQFTMSFRPNVGDDFSGGEGLPEPFNNGSFRSYGAATLSVDNKEMIICACNPVEISGQNYMNCDLYSTTYELTDEAGGKYKWSPLENLGDKINGKGRWDAQPSLSADGNTLYYTVNGPNTRDNDIFVVERNSDGTWGEARSFDEVNTAGKDKSPFLHQDSETLYFVSEATKERPGVGGLDIYYVRKDGNGWTEPKNIGYPINTEDDELGLFVSIDGEIAYYSSRQGGNWNIYSFELYEDARPKSVAILKGELKDSNGQPVENATIEVMYEGSDEVTQVKVNGNDGKYATIVKKDTPGDVMVTVKKEGHAFDSKVIEKEQLQKKDVTIRNNDLNVKQLEVGAAYTINDILYATNSAVLNGRSKFILKGFARFLTENPTISVVIQGHTDDVGDDAENLTLSENRAQGVQEYLISLGIDEKRLSAKGYGETMPKVANDSAPNRARNRRTDFVIGGM